MTGEGHEGRLQGRLIGLGVCGSIAAYKAVELLRRLTAEGADVVVMLTPAAARFVGPLTFAALSRHPVETDVLGLLPDQRIGHIVVADSADAIVVAPATARWLGAMSNGLATDAVVAACLATSAPVVVAPAMDGDMWTHRATQDNVNRLQRDFGYLLVPPEIGSLASGQSGVGRLAELDLIVDAVARAVVDRPIRQPDAASRPPLAAHGPDALDLDGRHVVVSAGGTAEPIDPVRFIGNRSTGRMGAAVAQAALDRGAQVTIVAGRTDVPLPADSRIVHAETTAAMRDAVLEAMVDLAADALVMAAAVADFRPAHVVDTKLTRDSPLTLELEPTEDILAEVGRRVASLDPRPFIVGFAAETGSLDRIADKLRRKGADLLIANDVTEPGSGFGTDTNRVVLLAPDGTRDEQPLLTKREVADRILDRVAAALDERDARAHTAGTARETGA
jgi:phosphopantothenoylcysteine decarboxylase/phosphopantothenate--cysteine ligase